MNQLKSSLCQRIRISLGISLIFLASAVFQLNAAENPSSPANSAGMNAYNDGSYLIGPTNLIVIKVLGEEGLQQTFRVDESGFITHPLLDRVKVGGRTVSETEQMIKQMLAGDYILNPNVTVFVLEHSRFSVLGEVRKAGNYEILGRLSIEEGISIAGGFTPLANTQKVKILRRDESGEKTLIVNIKEIMDGKAQSIDIHAGDVIEVQKSFF